MAASVSFGSGSVLLILANGLFRLHLSILPESAPPGKAYRSLTDTIIQRLQGAYSVPEVDINKSLILNTYLLIHNIRGGRKVTNRKHDRSADEILTLWQEEND